MPGGIKLSVPRPTAGIARTNAGPQVVMPGLVPGIHVLLSSAKLKDVDGRDKPGHDEDPHPGFESV
jgi:hypothetical protein